MLKSNIRTVSSSFERFLDGEINITRNIRQIASTSQAHLREFLKNEAGRDSSFPQLLDREDFIGGSFGRHTKNWPLDDIDIYLPLNGVGLVYQQNGHIEPFDVVSKGSLPNPLLEDRWADSRMVSPQKLIRGFTSVLRRHYPEETAVSANGEAISVRMSYGKTDSGDGLGYDIVPCFKLLARNPGDQDFYLISNGNNGWISTDPSFDVDLANQLNRFHNGLYRKAVKLVKWWNKNLLASGFPSYYVELAIAREFRRRAEQNQRISTIGSAVSNGLCALSIAVQAGDQNPWLSRAPKVERGELSELVRMRLILASYQSTTAVSSENSGEVESALNIWSEIFGPRFPIF